MASRVGVPAAGEVGPWRPRPRSLLLVALGVLGVAALLSIAVGAAVIPLGEVWRALVAPTGAPSDIVVRELRVPRTVLAILVGAALAVAGALMQGHTRNPLAEPGLLGVSAGAGFALVCAVEYLGVAGLYTSVWFAFGGAAVASVLVFGLASLSGTGAGRGATPVTMALAGVAVSQLLLAFTSVVVLGGGASLDTYRFWAVGALDDRTAFDALQIAPFVVAGLLLAAANAPALNVLALGEDTARGLGRHVGRARALGVTAITLLAGSAVAVSGPIGFVGLVAPHVVRPFTGPDHRWVLPASALVGAALVLLADVVGRVVVRPGELQVGIVLGVVGAPFFIWLVRRRMVRL